MPVVFAFVLVILAVFHFSKTPDEIAMDTVSRGRVQWQSPSIERLQAALLVCQQSVNMPARLSDECDQRLDDAKIMIDAYFTCAQSREKPACEKLLNKIDEERDQFEITLKLLDIRRVHVVDLDVWNPQNEFLFAHWSWRDRWPWLRKMALTFLPYAILISLAVGLIQAAISNVRRRREATERIRAEEAERHRRELAMQEIEERKRTIKETNRRKAAEQAEQAHRAAQAAAVEQEQRRRLEMQAQEKRRRELTQEKILREEAARALTGISIGSNANLKGSNPSTKRKQILKK